MNYNDRYVKDYVEFGSIDEAQEYADKMGYLYATSLDKSLNPSPIKVNGTWCLEVTHWLVTKSKTVEGIV